MEDQNRERGTPSGEELLRDIEQRRQVWQQRWIDWERERARRLMVRVNYQAITGIRAENPIPNNPGRFSTAVERVSSAAPRIFGVEMPDGYYKVIAASDANASVIGTIVYMENARLVPQGVDVASLIVRGFGFARVHVLSEKEHELLIQKTEEEMHRKALEHPDNRYLRRCAHCGGSATLGHLYKGVNERDFWWYVECTVCGVYNEGFSGKSEAMEWWNCRDDKAANPQIDISVKTTRIEIEHGDLQPIKINRG